MLELCPYKQVASVIGQDNIFCPAEEEPWSGPDSWVVVFPD